MKLSARLILLLTFAVSFVMVVASLLLLRQRENTLQEAARDEVRAHALTLKIALEEDYLTGRTLDAQRLINRLGENTGISNVVLFDAEGKIIAISNALASEEFKYLSAAREVIANGKAIEIGRSIGGEDYFSLVMPLQVENRRVGALEIVQPISFVNAHITKARLDIAITVLLLFMTILLVVTFLTRHNLARPIQKLLDGAVAVGHGDLSYRVAVRPHWGELAQLAREFNRMADSLDEQRRAAAREAEEKLNLERRLRHSEHLAALGRLAAGVAHEMGAPLQVIDGRAKQLLSNPDLLVEPRQRNLTIIRNQAERITRIIRQMLNLSRPYHLRLERIRLALPALETLELIEVQAASSGVKIEFRGDQQVEVEADQGLLEQVLLNIYRNAIQAMPQGGRLRIECLADALTKDGQPFAALRCSDTGGGIAPEHLAHVFDPFFTTKEVGQGTGLGLPISNRIIADHNGWIEADNEAEGGAVFTVYLPQAKQPARQEAAEEVLV